MRNHETFIYVRTYVLYIHVFGSLNDKPTYNFFYKIEAHES